MYKVEVISPFNDALTGKRLLPFDTLTTDDAERVRDIVSRRLGILVEAKARTKKKKTGKTILIYQKLLYCIGGIETWDYNLAQIFENKNLKFVFGAADVDQMIRLSEFADVEVDAGWKSYECDVFISANYDGGAVILDRVKARKRYQTIHSDFKALTECIGKWANFDLHLDSRFDAILTASKTAQKGLQDGFGIKSTVAPNPLAKVAQKPIILVTLSRASEEKGIDKVAKVAQEFNKRNLPFIWFVASTLDQNMPVKAELEGTRNIVLLEPSLLSQRLLYNADYLCQFSLTETYCYSMHEALQAGVAVLATKFDQATKYIKDGKNGYLLEHDLSNLDDDLIKKIFTNIPKGFEHEEKVDPIWSKIMKGEI